MLNRTAAEDPPGARGGEGQTENAAKSNHGGSRGKVGTEHRQKGNIEGKEKWVNEKMLRRSKGREIEGKKNV